jgi:nitroreductase
MSWANIRRRLGEIRWCLNAYLRAGQSALIECHRYLQFSSTLTRTKSSATLQGLIIRQAHAIEVGLTYKPTRPGFAESTVEALIGNLNDYLVVKPANSLVVHVVQTLVEYCRVNRELDHDVGQIELDTSKLARKAGVEVSAAEPLFPMPYSVSVEHGFRDFARGRRSCREYREKPVDIELLEDAVRSALSSPSACNRQPCRVYVLDDPDVRQRALDLQNNRSAWRSTAGRILIVTVDQGFYNGVREYNAAYVDGGLFCMTLVYALHAQGLGTCMLNLNISVSDLNLLRETIGATRGEVFVMMIAAGHAARDAPVCRKFQRSASEVIQLIEPQHPVPRDSIHPAA